MPAPPAAQRERPLFKTRPRGGGRPAANGRTAVRAAASDVAVGKAHGRTHRRGQRSSWCDSGTARAARGRGGGGLAHVKDRQPAVLRGVQNAIARPDARLTVELPVSVRPAASPPATTNHNRPEPHQWPAAAPIDRPRVTPATPRHAATPAVPNIWVSHRAGGPPPGTRLTALTWHGAAGGCAWLCVRRREGGPRCSVLYCRLSSPHGPTERGGKGVVLVKPSPAVAANPGAARRADTAVQSHRTPAHTIRCHGPGFPLSSERSPAGSASR